LLKDPAFKAKTHESYPGLPGPFSLLFTGLSFVSIQDVSDRAAKLIEQQKAKIERDASKYPPGLKEQYDVMIQLMKDNDVPDIEIIVWPFSFNPDTSKPYIGLLPVIGHPFSRGTIHVNSVDPKESPAIDPHYFEEEVDFEVLVDAFKFARKVAETGAFKELTVAEASPGADIVTDEQIREHVRGKLSTIWHGCGSLSMLPHDKGGVVDSRLKVYGTKNIRVVDLSILPLLVNSHTQATVYGIAEMAADIIKEDTT